MYSVSQAYKALMAGDSIQTRLTFTIGNDEYTEENILANSFKITNQCTDTKDIVLGSVYIGQLTAILRNVNITRNNWSNQVITPTFSVLIDEEEDEWEDVPLGQFTITDATWKASGVEIKAYDNMRKFDKPFSLNQSSGFMYDFLLYACSECDVELAQSEIEIKALPNGTQYFVYYSDVDVSTWRDFISWIAQTMGGYAIVNREGKLEIHSYGQEAVDSLGKSNRHTGGAFSDYTTKYTMLSYVVIEGNETKVVSASPNDGSLMTLGANPFLQSSAIAEQAVQNILTAIGNIRYNPFKVSTISNPAYDLGDVIEFTDGIAGTSSLCCVQKYTFQLHKKIELSGYGADPNSAAAKSKIQKELSNVAKSAALSEMGFTEYRNVSEITATNERKQIVRLKLSTNATTKAHIHCSVNLQTVADADVTGIIATYVLDGTEQDLHPQETYIDGHHVLHLMYILPMVTNEITYFYIWLTAVDGSYTIAREGVWAYASGVGLVGDDVWDGIISIDDIYDPITVDINLTIVECEEELSVALQTPIGVSRFDSVHEVEIPETALEGTWLDAVTIIGDFGSRAIITESGEYNIAIEDGDALYTE